MEDMLNHKTRIKRFVQDKNYETINTTESGISVYYLNCNNCNIIISSKVIAIFFENCNNCNITIERCMTPLHALRCDNCHFTIKGGDIFQLDLCNRVLIDLSKGTSRMYYVVYCKTWDVWLNVTADGIYTCNLWNDYFGEQIRTSVHYNPDRVIFKTQRI
jgi:hypothetical protein